MSSILARSRSRRWLTGVGAIIVIALIVGAFALILARAHAGPSQAAAQPTAGCSAIPAGYHGGPLLYWSATAPRVGAVAAAASRLCAVGFHAGEHVTLSGDAATPPTTVQADGHGSFTTLIIQPISSCNQALRQTLLAQGNMGSHASLVLPVMPARECPAPTG